MWTYKGTFEFDIGKGHGKWKYDFFTIACEEDFKALIEYYRAFCSRFDYFPDKYNTVKDNKNLSPNVKTEMKKHDANVSLTILEEKQLEDGSNVRDMIVNRKISDSIYETSIFKFFHFIANSPMRYYRQGMAFTKAQCFSAAIECYTEAIRLDTGSFLLFRQRGWAYLLINDYDSAIRDCTKAAELNPDDAKSYFTRGCAYAEKGNYDYAIADYTKTIELDPNGAAAAYYYRAIAYNEKGDFDNAIADYTQAMELDPNMAEAYKAAGLRTNTRK